MTNYDANDHWLSLQNRTNRKMQKQKASNFYGEQFVVHLSVLLRDYDQPQLYAE